MNIIANILAVATIAVLMGLSLSADGLSALGWFVAAAAVTAARWPNHT